MTRSDERVVGRAVGLTAAPVHSSSVEGGASGPVEGVVCHGRIALFDMQTGRVLHVHSILAPRGATPPAAAELELRARGLASRFHHDVDALGALPLDAASPPPRRSRVDLATKRIVAEPAPPRA